MSDFDEADQQAVVPVVPKSANKVVLLGAKVLQTHKEVRKVLPEEKYVENLEKLIVRDYFPELPKLKAQSEYLEAVARNDHAKIRELQIRYSTRRTDRRTSPSARPSSPRVFDPDTPVPSTSGEGKLPYANEEGDNEKLLHKKKKDPLDALSVQAYLDKYTSEDNASFEEIAALHEKRERIRNAWMYEAEQRHNDNYIERTRQIKAADEQLVALRNGDGDRPNDIDNWAYKARNSVLFNPEDAPLTMAEYIERSKRNQQVINREGTRFNEKLIQQPHQSAMARAALQQAVNNLGHVDVTGKEMGVVNAQSLGIVATPTPAPGVDESPLMTWGEIEGTPFRLDGSDIIAAPEDAPVFKIPDVPVRERVANDIADEIAKRYRQKRRHAMEQAEKLHAKTPKFGSSRTSDKLAVMSPAARRLATTKLGLKLGTDKSLKASYSPKVKTPGSSSKSLYSPALYNSIKIKKEPTPSRPPASITDNLFRLPASPAEEPQSSKDSAVPSKPRAADFF